MRGSHRRFSKRCYFRVILSFVNKKKSLKAQQKALVFARGEIFRFFSIWTSYGIRINDFFLSITKMDDEYKYANKKLIEVRNFPYKFSFFWIS